MTKTTVMKNSSKLSQTTSHVIRRKQVVCFHLPHDPSFCADPNLSFGVCPQFQSKNMIFGTGM